MAIKSPFKKATPAKPEAQGEDEHKVAPVDPQPAEEKPQEPSPVPVVRRRID